MIRRSFIELVSKRFFKGKAILIHGARQVGKTTLINNLLNDRPEKSLKLNGDEPDVRELLQDINSGRWKSILGNAKILFVDEAQNIPNVGLSLKIVVDQIKDVQVIATGSSSFELQNSTNEPLTGRKYEFKLFPLSFSEMAAHHGLLEERRMLEHRMVFGYYPEIVSNMGEEAELLKLLTSSYLYKDILMLDGIKKPSLLDKLLRALALQLGQEVNYNELAQAVGADRGTVERYIDVLEKVFVIYSLPAFSKNVRNEIKKGRKIYFYDNGIRNAIIGNLNHLSSRTDVGALWENFILSERMKWLNQHSKGVQKFFWRTTQQQEIDYIEESFDRLDAFEFKWNPKKKAKFPLTFTKNYDVTDTHLVNQQNYDQYLL